MVFLPKSYLQLLLLLIMVAGLLCCPPVLAEQVIDLAKQSNPNGAITHIQPLDGMDEQRFSLQDNQRQAINIIVPATGTVQAELAALANWQGATLVMGATSLEADEAMNHWVGLPANVPVLRQRAGVLLRFGQQTQGAYLLNWLAKQGALAPAERLALDQLDNPDIQRQLLNSLASIQANTNQLSDSKSSLSTAEKDWLNNSWQAWVKGLSVVEGLYNGVNDTYIQPKLSVAAKRQQQAVLQGFVGKQRQQLLFHQRKLLNNNQVPKRFKSLHQAIRTWFEVNMSVVNLMAAQLSGPQWYQPYQPAVTNPAQLLEASAMAHANIRQAAKDWVDSPVLLPSQIWLFEQGFSPQVAQQLAATTTIDQTATIVWQELTGN